MAYTILRPSYFLEMWLGPALGWDFAAGTARVLGSGEQRVNWISARDVVAAIVACVDNPQAHGQTIELGGPEALSPRSSSGKRARRPAPTRRSSRR
jgi:uncharacterized protein YbjT (DUF2867 family)